MMMKVKIICKSCGYENIIFIEETKNSSKNYLCENCFEIIMNSEFYSGTVYFLSNKSMPGYLKIGCTSRNIIDRVKELDKSTSVPEPFKIEAYFISKNQFSDELEIHRLFDEYRVPNKEFFKITLNEALNKVKNNIHKFSFNSENIKILNSSSATNLGKSNKSFMGFKDKGESSIIVKDAFVTKKHVELNKDHKKLKKDLNFDYVNDHIAKERGLVPDCFGKRLKNKAIAEKCLSCKHEIPCLNIS